jgi:hypothetical protein
MSIVLRDALQAKSHRTVLAATGSKGLVELHNGIIHVDSAFGHGASFEVAFPRPDIPRVVDEPHSLV